MVCLSPMKIKPEVKEKLNSLKIHPRQSYSEVIDELIKEHLIVKEEKENGL